MSVVAAYHIFVCTLFPVQGGTCNPHTFLNQTQRTHKYMIC